MLHNFVLTVVLFEAFNICYKEGTQVHKSYKENWNRRRLSVVKGKNETTPLTGLY